LSQGIEKKREEKKGRGKAREENLSVVFSECDPDMDDSARLSEKTHYKIWTLAG
jgi:hypothetical protein